MNDLVDMNFNEQNDQFWALLGRAPKHNHREIRRLKRKQQRKARKIQQKHQRSKR